MKSYCSLTVMMSALLIYGISQSAAATTRSWSTKYATQKSTYYIYITPGTNTRYTGGSTKTPSSTTKKDSTKTPPTTTTTITTSTTTTPEPEVDVTVSLRFNFKYQQAIKDGKEAFEQKARSKVATLAQIDEDRVENVKVFEGADGNLRLNFTIIKGEPNEPKVDTAVYTLKYNVNTARFTIDLDGTKVTSVHTYFVQEDATATTTTKPSTTPKPDVDVHVSLRFNIKFQQAIKDGKEAFEKNARSKVATVAQIDEDRIKNVQVYEGVDGNLYLNFTIIKGQPNEPNVGATVYTLKYNVITARFTIDLDGTQVTADHTYFVQEDAKDEVTEKSDGWPPLYWVLIALAIVVFILIVVAIIIIIVIRRRKAAENGHYLYREDSVRGTVIEPSDSLPRGYQNGHVIMGHSLSEDDKTY